jgi:tetratricopeptide (TPR) repeat protein
MAPAACLLRAETLAAAAHEWRHVACVWSRLGDVVAVERCLASASRSATCAEERLAVCDDWLALCGDGLRARTELLRAGGNEQTAKGFCALARGDRALLGGDRAERLLGRAQTWAVTHLDWVEIGFHYRLLTQDDARAWACFAQARQVADTLPQRLELARLVFRKFPDPARAYELVESLRIVGAAVEVLCTLAQTWVELGQPAKALHRMAQAADLAVTAADWKDLSYAWHVLEDPERALQCANLASAKADKVHDLEDLARHWQRHLGQPDGARAALQRAESMARWDFEWRALERAWREILRDEGAAARCRAEAER